MMPELEKIIMFVFLSVLLCAAPGPTMLFTITQGLSKKPSKAIIGICGTLSANMIWILLSSIGVGTLIQDSGFLLSILRYMGAVYLAYLGIMSLLNARGTGLQISADQGTTLLIVYRQGFLTTMTNPKALLCYLSFLPQFISGQRSYGFEILCWGLGYLCVIVLVMGSYAALALKLARYFSNARFQVNSKRVVGVGFISASLSLLKS